MLFTRFLLVFALCTASVRATPDLEASGASKSKYGPNCVDVVVPVTISAKNTNFPSIITALLQFFPLAPTNNILAALFNVVGSLVNLPFTSFVSGTYKIAGTYCEPEENIPSRRNTIQFLAHPATYDRSYWFGGNYPGFNGTQYSWVSYASKLGYPTFSFDRLGNGLSDHPNSITIVQCPAQAATIHELVKLARAGSGPFPRRFNKLIFVGNSLGSIVGNFINVEYPNDFESSILNGFGKFWANAIPGFTLTADLLPAYLTDPHFRFLNGDLGYLRANNAKGVAYLLFYGPNQFYDPNFIALDYASRGIITIGEAITGGLGISTAYAYKGSVLVMNGNQDVVFCGTFDLPIDGPGNCNGTGILAQTKDLYPNAKYSSFSLDNSGHCWHHHYTAQTGFKYAHDWLTAQGL